MLNVHTHTQLTHKNRLRGQFVCTYQLVDLRQETTLVWQCNCELKVEPLHAYSHENYNVDKCILGTIIIIIHNFLDVINTDASLVPRPYSQYTVATEPLTKGRLGTSNFLFQRFN